MKQFLILALLLLAVGCSTQYESAADTTSVAGQVVDAETVGQEHHVILRMEDSVPELDQITVSQGDTVKFEVSNLGDEYIVFIVDGIHEEEIPASATAVFTVTASEKGRFGYGNRVEENKGLLIVE